MLSPSSEKYSLSTAKNELSSYLLEASKPTFPLRSQSLGGRLIRWIRQIIHSIKEYCLPGSLASAVYDDIFSNYCKSYRSRREDQLNVDSEFAKAVICVLATSHDKKTSTVWTKTAFKVNKYAAVSWIRSQTSLCKAFKLFLLKNEVAGLKFMIKENSFEIDLLHRLFQKWESKLEANKKDLSSNENLSPEDIWMALFGENFKAEGDFYSRIEEKVGRILLFLKPVLDELEPHTKLWAAEQLFHYAAKEEDLKPTPEQGDVRSKLANVLEVDSDRDEVLENPEIVPYIKDLYLAICAFAKSNIKEPLDKGACYATALLISANPIQEDSIDNLVMTYLVNLKKWNLDFSQIKTLKNLWQQMTGIEEEKYPEDGKFLKIFDTSVSINMGFLRNSKQEDRQNPDWRNLRQVEYFVEQLTSSKEGPRLVTDQLKKWNFLCDTFLRMHNSSFDQRLFYEFATGKKFSSLPSTSQEWVEMVLRESEMRVPTNWEAWGNLVEFGVPPEVAAEKINSDEPLTLSKSEFSGEQLAIPRELSSNNLTVEINRGGFGNAKFYLAEGGMVTPFEPGNLLDKLKQLYKNNELQEKAINVFFGQTIVYPFNHILLVETLRQSKKLEACPQFNMDDCSFTISQENSDGDIKVRVYYKSPDNYMSYKFTNDGQFIVDDFNLICV